MTSEIEEAYEKGVQAGLTRILRLAVKELGPAAESTSRLAIERVEAIAMLRCICAAHGDNDWPDNLHLADIIEKHLFRHLSN